jgi:hypothetical protein
MKMSKAFSLGVLLGAISGASAEHRSIRVERPINEGGNNGGNGGNDENPWMQFQGLCSESDSDCVKTNRAIGGDGELCSPLEWNVPSVPGARCKTCKGDPCAASCEVQDREGNYLFATIECTRN